MKKLIPAMCMLLIAAALLGTSTYAWFSMNSKVTANGMTITAKTDSVFLQIVAGTDKTAFKDNEAQTSVNVNATTPNGLKATHVCKGIVSGALTPLADNKNEGVAFSTGLKFVEAFSNNPALHNGGTMTYEDVTDTAKGNTTTYTLLSNLLVRLNPSAGANQSAENLRVDAVDITSTGSDVMLGSVRVLIVCGEQWALWSNGTEIAYSHDATVTGTGGSTTLTSVLAETVTTTSGQEKSVQVYVYFDGEESTTTTNNAATLNTDGYTVEVSFVVD